MREWLIVIDGFAAGWIEALVRACWQGGLALGLVWVACRLFPRISPRARSWLWRLAFLKLAVAFLSPATIDVELLPAPVASVAQERPAASPGTTFAPEVTLTAQGTARLPVSGWPPATRLSLAGWLFLAWCFGVGAHLVRLCRDHGQAQRLRRTGRRADDERLERWRAEAAERLGLRRRTRLLISAVVTKPLLLGACRPTIILPTQCLANSTPAQTRLVLAHELAHAKRHDLWWGWLLWLGETLFYFHPLVWLASAEWRLTQEMACDALAIGATESPLAEYGAMLLEVSSGASGPLTASRSVAVGIVETKRNLERRLEAMKLIRQKLTKRIRVVTACLLGAGGLATLPWGVVAAKAPPAEQAPWAPVRNEAELAETRGDDQSTPSPSKAATAARAPETEREKEVRVFSLRYADAESVAKYLQALSQADSTDPGEADRKFTVVADPRTGAVIVRAPQDEMARCMKLISALDVETAEGERSVDNGPEANHSRRPLPIMAPRAGFVQKVFVTSGKAVKTGDPLIQLDDREARGRLRNAVAQLEIAKAALAIQEAEARGIFRDCERLQALTAKGAVPADELEAKETAQEVAKARVAKAQAELGLATQLVVQAENEVALLIIRAPKDGTVCRVRVQAGEYVAGAPSQPLMVID